MSATSVPSIAEVDPFSDPILKDPYDYYAQLREAGPAIYLPRYDAWAVGGYEDVRKALREWDAFSSAGGVFLTPDRNKELSGRSMITVDPPVHDQMRKVYQEHISLRPLRAVEAAIVARAESLVEQLVERGSFDAVHDLGAAFSVQTVGDYLGLPTENREGLLVYSNAVFDTHGPLNDRHRSGLEQMPALFDYLESLAEPGRLAPDGWGAAMLGAAADGRFPEAWVKGAIASFIVAGMDTTMNAISSAVWLLAEHPDQWRSVCEEPELVPRAFNEALRCESPIQWFSRQTTRTCEIGDVEVPEGARVILAYAAANRDERVFEDASRFDVHRQGPGHIAFGFGVHGCVGQALARIEGNAVLAALASRVRSIEVLSARRHLNNALRGFGELRVAVS